MKKAEDDLGAALEASAKLPNLLFARALLRKDAGDLKGADADYEKALALNPTFRRAMYNKVWTSKMLGEFTEAKIEAQRLVDNDPNNSEHWNLLGNVQLIFGEYQGALDSYNEALNIDPEYREALFNRGLALCMNFALSSGCYDLETAAEMGIRTRGRGLFVLLRLLNKKGYTAFRSIWVGFSLQSKGGRQLLQSC